MSYNLTINVILENLIKALASKSRKINLIALDINNFVANPTLSQGVRNRK